DRRLDHGVARVLARQAEDSGGAGKQGEHADHGEERQQGKDIRLRVPAADQEVSNGRAHQGDGDQQHQPDAPVAFAAVERDELARFRRALAQSMVQVLRRHAADPDSINATHPVSRFRSSPTPAARSMRTSESKDTGKIYDSSAALNPKFATRLAAPLGELRVRGTSP